MRNLDLTACLAYIPRLAPPRTTRTSRCAAAVRCAPGESVHDGLPADPTEHRPDGVRRPGGRPGGRGERGPQCLGVVQRHGPRSEEHTSELQSQSNLVCRLLLEKKKERTITK